MTKAVIWFTGLSGSGKTTIALALKQRLDAQGKKVLILDGDDVRAKINRRLGFSREDIKKNNRLIAEMAVQQANYDFILIPVISPYREDREMAKSIIGDSFVELFVNCPLQECIQRDVKGLYKKALSGEINNFIGVADSNPYEAPSAPDLEIKTNQMDLDRSMEMIFEFLRKKNKVGN